MTAGRLGAPAVGALAALLASIAACSDLGGGGDTPVAIEIRVPAAAQGASPLVEIGDTLFLGSRALNQAGDSVAATITWRTPDTAFIGLDPTTGRVTGKKPGTGRIQARTGTLISDFVTFTVVPAAESLLVVAPDSFRMPTTYSVAGPLVAQLDTIAPDGPLANRLIVYQLLLPVFGAVEDTATLNGGVLVRSALTGATGQPTSPVTVRAVAGRARPDSVRVEVDAYHPSGTPVAGSGQTFIVRFD